MIWQTFFGHFHHSALGMALIQCIKNNSEKLTQESPQHPFIPPRMPPFCYGPQAIRLRNTTAGYIIASKYVTLISLISLLHMRYHNGSVKKKIPPQVSPDLSDDPFRSHRIGDIITPRLIQAPPDITIKRALALMQENRSAYIVVADNNRVVGMLTDTDLVNQVIGRAMDWKRPLKDFMTPDPVVLSPKDTIGTAIQTMVAGRFYHIPLVNDKNELVNVLSVRTLIRFIAEFYPAEVYNLPPTSRQYLATAEGG